MAWSSEVNTFLTVAPLVVAAIGLVYYGRKKMQKLGVIYVILFYVKWFLGVAVTVAAFSAIIFSSEYFKAEGYPLVLSLPIGAFVWFVPMNYISKFFAKLEKKYKKESSKE